MSPKTNEFLREPPLFDRLRPLLAGHDTPVYLVGGAVRDALLGRPSYDLDFVLAEDTISLAFTVADALRAPAYVLDRERDIGRVILPASGRSSATVLDFARFRGPDLSADLRARDFTINAMAVKAAAEAGEEESIIDPCGGRADLEARLLHLTHPAAIADDPLRALRAVRLSRQLDFEIAPETAAAAREAAPHLQGISRERVRDELLKLLQGPAPHQALNQMVDLHLLPVILPEIAVLHDVEQSAPHHEPVQAHTFSVLRRLLLVEQALAADGTCEDTFVSELHTLLAPYAAELREHLARDVDGNIDGRAALRLGALFHDVGKAQTATIEEDGRIRFFGHDKEGATLTATRLRALRLSNVAITHVRAIVGGHMRPLHLSQVERLTRRAVYRYFQATKDAGLDIGLLTLADHLATHDGPGPEEQWRALLAVVDRLFRHYFHNYEETVAPPPLLNGGELMSALNLQPGPQIGRLLRLIQEAQAAGDVNTREEALEIARLEIGRLGD